MHPCPGSSGSSFFPLFFVAAFSLLLPALRAQQTASTAPVPAPLLSAQKVFLANGGGDPVSLEVFKKAGWVNEPYNSVYAQLKSWGHWQLLSSPEGADLIVTVRFTAPAGSYSSGLPSYLPQEDLTLLDGKTHVPLWTVNQTFQGAFRKSTWEKNYGEGVTDLVNQLKALTTPPTP